MKKKHWLIIVAVIMAGIQFIRIDKKMPQVPEEADFINITKPAGEIANIIKTSCYDCHSYQVKYPWYTEIAPVSWYIKHHVDEGLERVNFSDWAAYSTKKSIRKLEACAETVELENMPLGTYTLIHQKAELSVEQRKKLSNWFINEAEKIRN